MLQENLIKMAQAACFQKGPVSYHLGSAIAAFIPSH